MIIDAENLFSDEQAVTADAASTNIIQLHEERRIGTGETLHVVVVVTEDMADTGSNSTCTITLESDDAAAFGSATARMTIGTFAAETVAGSRLIAKLPTDVLTEAFIRLKYTMANGNLSAGKFTAFLAKDIDAWRAYADNITIS